MNVDIFGYFAAILTTAAFLPQLIKTLKTKKADDVSLTTLIMFITGVLSWIIYGYKISSLPILIANLITLILNLLILISKIYFSKKLKWVKIFLKVTNFRFITWILIKIDQKFTDLENFKMLGLV